MGVLETEVWIQDQFTSVAKNKIMNE